MHRTIAPALLIAALSLSTASLAQSIGSPNDPQPDNGNYTVKTTDTMWDLARLYLTDPFNWPQIRNVNPHVKNPHWIYPGDRLHIPGLGTVAADATRIIIPETPAGTPLPASDSIPPAVSPEAALDAALRNLISQRFFLGTYLSQAAFLWSQRDAKNLVLPGDAEIAGEKGRVSFQKFEEIPITAIGPREYQKGDSVEIFHSDRYLNYDGAVQSLVRRIGRGRISKADRTGTWLTIDEMWDVIRNKDRIAPLTRFQDRIIDGFENAERPIEATILTRVEPSETAYLYQSFIVDKGENEQIRIGDIFSIHNVESARNKQKIVSPDAVASACVVHVNATSSTLVILGLSGTELSVGDQARIFKRTVFR